MRSRRTWECDGGPPRCSADARVAGSYVKLVTTHAQSKPISGIATYRTRRAIPRLAPQQLEEFFRD